MNAAPARYAMLRTTRQGFDEADRRIRDALKAEGFGVLTEIDVQATLKAKIGVDMAPYRILGACNPVMANRALQLDPDVGLLLPCNVVVRAVADGETIVDALDPVVQMEVAHNDRLAAVAIEVREKIARALDAAVKG